MIGGIGAEVVAGVGEIEFVGVAWGEIGILGAGRG